MKNTSLKDLEKQILLLLNECGKSDEPFEERLNRLEDLFKQRRELNKLLNN